MRAAVVAAAGLAAVASGCAAALREPPPVTAIARSAPAAVKGGVTDLLAEANASFARRPDLEAVARAEALYLEAAAADESRVEGLLGAVRAKTWLAEHVPAASERETLAVSAVQAAQWCGRRAPEDRACDYWLAVALGLQARERPSTAEDALPRMVTLLHRAVVADPALDEAGPYRVLALVFLKAPAWPLGPGDPEAGLAEARRAVALRPRHPPNQVALGEALAAAGQEQAARKAYSEAFDLARSRQAAGDPDAGDWMRQAERALAQ